MAYNRRYNPDSLPAHVEPEEAAQRLSSPRQSSSSFARPSDPYASKAPLSSPPAPVSGPRNDRYRPSSPQQGPRPSGGSQRGSYDDYDRRPRPPRDGRDDARDHQRQGSYGSSSGRYDSQRPPPPPPPPQPSSDPYSRTPAPPGPRPGSEKDELWKLFRAVDKDSSGHLSEQELSRALINGDQSSFDPHTIKMMIRMFDVDRSGSIDFDEFCGLWGFLTEWRKLFDRFDVDRSGNISFDEFSDALVAFGYRLSPNYIKLLFNTYDVRGRGTLSFDLFVQACISLKRMTDVFKKYDSDRDGFITLSFEEFLTGSQALFLFNSISPVTDKGLY